jgi:hypothetical protein
VYDFRARVLFVTLLVAVFGFALAFLWLVLSLY